MFLVETATEFILFLAVCQPFYLHRQCKQTKRDSKLPKLKTLASVRLENFGNFVACVQSPIFSDPLLLTENLLEASVISGLVLSHGMSALRMENCLQGNQARFLLSNAISIQTCLLCAGELFILALKKYAQKL